MSSEPLADQRTASVHQNWPQLPSLKLHHIGERGVVRTERGASDLGDDNLSLAPGSLLPAAHVVYRLLTRTYSSVRSEPHAVALASASPSVTLLRTSRATTPAFAAPAS